jgi:uncharacterized protein (DUF885 family)
MLNPPWHEATAWRNSEKQNVMKISLTIAIFLAVSGIASAYTAAEIAAESKKANDFFEKCWDETLSRHPVDESYYGTKTHYDQLEDLSDAKATADEKVWERQLADLKRNIKFEALDAQTQLSYKLFQREAAREAEEFKYRFGIYLVSQMRGVYAQMPTFMINIHKIDEQLIEQFGKAAQPRDVRLRVFHVIELREKAKKLLGNRLDIRQFHEVVLSNGSVPLDVLEELVDRWIQSKRADYP